MSNALLSVLPQISVMVILAIALLLFLQNRIRYDIIAILIMLGVITTGVLSYEDVFSNFGNPAIIIVASMFIISEAFVRSGIVDYIASRFSFFYTKPMWGLGVLVVIVTILSAFVNGAGALAMSIPIAIHLAKKSNTSIALFLLPLAFATHLGGFMTLIGTPRNIIISDFREEYLGAPFAMFDFLPVGGSVAIIGIIFLVIIAWRLIPKKQTNENEEVLPERKYTTEVFIPNESKVANLTIKEFERLGKNTVDVVTVFRDEQSLTPSKNLKLRGSDTITLEGTIASLTENTNRFNLDLTGLRAKEKFVTNEDDYVTTEVIVPPYAKIIGWSWNTIPWQKRFGTNFIGLSRRNSEINSKIADAVFWPNDVLLLRGRSASVEETIKTLQLLPIATPEDEEISFGQDRTIFITLLIVTGAIAIATFNIVPLSVMFLTAAVLLILLNLVTLRQAYESVDLSVLFLLAGMITLGDSLIESGAASSLANALLGIGEFVGPITILMVVLLTSMLLADFMNTTASAVVMAPVAILLAESMSISADPLLMSVAIGASSAFLTPIGHESNTIVMQRGGYTFKDYARVGLPLELLIAIVTPPIILYFWPLYPAVG